MSYYSYSRDSSSSGSHDSRYTSNTTSLSGGYTTSLTSDSDGQTYRPWSSVRAASNDSGYGSSSSVSRISRPWKSESDIIRDKLSRPNGHSASGQTPTPPENQAAPIGPPSAKPVVYELLPISERLGLAWLVKFLKKPFRVIRQGTKQSGQGLREDRKKAASVGKTPDNAGKKENPANGHLPLPPGGQGGKANSVKTINIRREQGDSVKRSRSATPVSSSLASGRGRSRTPQDTNNADGVDKRVMTSVNPFSNSAASPERKLREAAARRKKEDAARQKRAFNSKGQTEPSEKPKSKR